MNIRKRLVVAAAVVLPVSGLVVLGGAQVASAGGPPVLSCSNLGANPSDATGGVTFDNGSGPGTAGLDLGAGLTNSTVTTTDSTALAVGGDVVVLSAEAIAGQTLQFGNPPSGPVYTVVSDTTGVRGVASLKNHETAVITPAATVAETKATQVTISPSTTGTYRTIDNASNGTAVTSGSSVVTANAGTFSNADVNQPVTVSWFDSSNQGWFSPYADPTVSSPAIVATYISGVNGTGTQATIGDWTAVGGSPANSVKSATVAGGAEESANVVVTVGSTAQATGTVGTDYDFALTGCQSSLHIVNGVIYPNNATFTNNGPVTNPSSALALESGVKPIDNAAITFPPALPAGYSWSNGDTPAGNAISVSFDSLKDALNLNTDAETFVGGVVPSADVYGTPKASMTFGVGSMVVCTEAQLQAIGTGSGGSGIDHGSISAAANAGAVGADVRANCDGGTNSSLTPAEAFDELAVVEADPNAQVAGSDGTSLAAIWQVGGTGSAIL